MNLNFGANEDEDLNKHEVSKEASVSDKGQRDFYESSDEEVTSLPMTTILLPAR